MRIVASFFLYASSCYSVVLVEELGFVFSILSGDYFAAEEGGINRGGFSGYFGGLAVAPAPYLVSV